MPRRRLRIRVPLLLAIAAVVLPLAMYVYGVSHLQARHSSLFEPSDLYVPRMIDVVILVWCAWVGSSVGSFLNVVAWRMPRGESISGRSHCPRCQTQLKARDNFPVFGWLALGGRCRTCHLPISPRYPIVEAAVGLTLTAVAMSQLYRLSLPRQSLHGHGGPFWTPTVDAGLLLTLLYHTVALAAVWAVGLIRLDGHRLPGRLVWFAMLATILPMLAFPALMVVPWQMTVAADWQAGQLYIDALVRVLASLAAATVMARSLARGLCPAADPKLDPLGKSTARLLDLIVILFVPTLIVGWQAAPAVVVLAAAISVGLRPLLPATSDSLGRFAIGMPLAMTVQLVFWRNLHAVRFTGDSGAPLPWWPSDNGSPWVVLAWAAAVLLLPIWLRDPATLPVEEPPAEDGEKEFEVEAAEDEDV